MPNPIYDTIYRIIETYIFGAVTAGTYEELVCILVSVTLSLYCLALPFILVHGLIKLFFPRGIL